MKRKKYDVAKDFEKWSKLNPPINKFSASLLQFFMAPFFKKQKSTKECSVERKSAVLKDTKIDFLVYTPNDLKENAPCLIYYHGGGFMLPATPQHYRKAREYAIACGCKVFFPNYPLAPKYKFPFPAEICFEFFKHIINNFEQFGINKDKIIVGGDSAGGSLSLIVCMMANDNQVKTPLAQMLIYPAIGLTEPTPSMIEFVDTGMCNSKDVEKYCKLYYKNEEDRKSRYSCALNLEDLSKYPPTYVETAQFDCLRDEAKLFADKLKESGVEVFENHTKKTIHGYDIAEASPIVKESMSKRISFLNEQFLCG